MRHIPLDASELKRTSVSDMLIESAFVGFATVKLLALDLAALTKVCRA